MQRAEKVRNVLIPDTLTAGDVGSRDNGNKEKGALRNCYNLATVPDLFCYRMWTREAEVCKFSFIIFGRIQYFFLRILCPFRWGCFKVQILFHCT